jgi:hypothetical protein
VTGSSHAIQSISPTATSAIDANAAKLALSGHPASRMRPNAQSASPPQLMLTRFMIP